MGRRQQESTARRAAAMHTDHWRNVQLQCKADAAQSVTRAHCRFCFAGEWSCEFVALKKVWRWWVLIYLAFCCFIRVRLVPDHSLDDQIIGWAKDKLNSFGCSCDFSQYLPSKKNKYSE